MILILGCSFSLGWYSYDGTKETLHTDYCWYDELDQPYQVYAHPGGGIMSYCGCLESIDITKYNAIIVQETWEPRIVIQQKFDYYEARPDVFAWTIDNAFHSKLGGLPNVQDKIAKQHNFQWQQGMSEWLWSIENHWNILVRACTSHLDHLAQQTGLPTYSYSFTGVKYPYKYIKYLDVKPATEQLFYKKDLHNPDLHFTQKGNTVLGQMIKKGLGDGLQ